MKEQAAAYEEPILPPQSAEVPARAGAVGVPAFGDVYAKYFPFVWRNVLRLGVPRSATDDVTQEVFIVVHRKLATFEGRSALGTWIYTILRRVVRDYLRSPTRTMASSTVDLESFSNTLAASVEQPLAQEQALAMVQQILTSMDEEKREVFVLAELEQMTAPEIAEMTGMNLNTIYARLRSARQQFDDIVLRLHARERWRLG